MIASKGGKGWRYVPGEVMTTRHGMRPVVRAESFPPGAAERKETPINAELTALRLTTDTGDVRWFGVDAAQITARLRMAVRGGFINPRNELAKFWPRVPRSDLP